MSPDAAENTILQAFLTAWGSTSLVALENQEDTPPADGSPWVRISVQHNDGEQASLGGDSGNRFFRASGFVFVQVFVLKGTGKKVLNQNSYTALKVFDSNIGGIWFRNGRVVSVPIPKEEKWAQQNVVVEFLYDDIR